jgi:hypothetical protein
LLPESGDLRINLQYSSAVDAPTSGAVFNKAARTLIDTCEALTGHISLDIASKLSELEVSGSHRRFLVQRLGSTGSTWVAKLLNSHPDVFCYHEGVIAKIFPSRSYGNAEILTFIDLIAEDRMHDAYAAVGDVGSTWLQHVTVFHRPAPPASGQAIEYTPECFSVGPVVHVCERTRAEMYRIDMGDQTE